MLTVNTLNLIIQIYGFFTDLSRNIISFKLMIEKQVMSAFLIQTLVLLMIKNLNGCEF
jgi:hypothetical protein